jgi:myo-inositol-1(or 4)-monophosphatase
VILIEEAGGVLTDFDGGERYWERGNIIAGSPGVSRDMLAIAARMMREDDIGS